MYCIEYGYECNLDTNGNPFPYEDDIYNSMHYQVAVYEFAAKVIKHYDIENVLDIGCGFGLKLIKHIFPICGKVTGMDLKFSIDFCKEFLHLGSVNWIQENVENPCVVFDDKFDLIIASDIVEHLMNPDNLFEYIRCHSHPNTFVIISTPERDAVRGKSDTGPSPNRAHVREWNQAEFEMYIRKSNFTIFESFLVKDIYFSKIETCQTLLIQECKNA